MPNSSWITLARGPRQLVVQEALEITSMLGELLVVHTHDEHGGVTGGGRNDHLLGTALHVSTSCLEPSEDTGGLDDVVSAGAAPVDGGRVLLVESLDGLAVDDDGAVVVAHSALKAPVHGVVLEHVLHVVGGDEGVVDGDDLHVGVGLRGPDHHAANATETVDANANGSRHTLKPDQSLRPH